MNEYQIDFEGMAPVWESIRITAENKDEAEALAHDQISHSFPEVSDITIIEVKEV